MDESFEIISEIADIEIIARGTSVNAQHSLNREFERGRWRKNSG